MVSAARKSGGMAAYKNKNGANDRKNVASAHSSRSKASHVQKQAGIKTGSVYGDYSLDVFSAITRETYEAVPADDLRNIERQYGNGFYVGVEKAIGKGFVITKELGSGDFGTTYAMCNRENSDLCYAVKVIRKVREKTEVEYEFAIQRKFAQAGIAPDVIGNKPYFYNYKGGHFAIIVMQRIDGVLDELLVTTLKPADLDLIFRELMKIVIRLAQNNLTHGDMHPGNVSYVFTRNSENTLTVRLQLIDFGWSLVGEASPATETTKILYTLQGNKKNTKWLEKNILAVIIANWPQLEVGSWDEIKKVVHALGNELEDKQKAAMKKFKRRKKL